ncbi:NUDIX domain-containing protein [Micromonospora sp. NPDC047134]|uniref:NUDIX domain-containing protein n=1 Tax=Micromonospora sp. NPDC047134 TaxID=3154340 RepID=UPI0034115EF3
MTRLYASAGSIVVCADLRRPQMLLLEQIRPTGERQVVAPKGRIEPGESPLIAAAREVSEEAGLHDMRYVAYLGQEAYRFTAHDGTPAQKTIDWFLFATTDTAATARQTEGFVAAQWHDLPDALTAASHASFHEYVRRADKIIAWRRSGPLDYSDTLSQAVWDFSRRANTLLAERPGAGAALCGSAARGDFIEGWSDLDLIAWGLEPASPSALALRQLAEEVSHRTGIRTSLHLAHPDEDSADGLDRLHAMKLHAVLRRTHIDVPTVAAPAHRRCPKCPATWPPISVTSASSLTSARRRLPPTPTVSIAPAAPWQRCPALPAKPSSASTRMHRSACLTSWPSSTGTGPALRPHGYSTTTTPTAVPARPTSSDPSSSPARCP